MVGLLTFATYGYWLSGPGRGWIDYDQTVDPSQLPSPDEAISAERHRSLTWPARELTSVQQQLIVQDLHRIAKLRKFQLIAAVVHPHYVQILIEHFEDTDIPRLVQLIKGALSRCLTVGWGDRPAESVEHQPLHHHKWWTRQYSWRNVQHQHDVKAILTQFETMQRTGAVVFFNPEFHRLLGGNIGNG